MNKKHIILLVAVAISASATGFLVWKAYSDYKKEQEAQKCVDEAYEAVRSANEATELAKKAMEDLHTTALTTAKSVDEVAAESMTEAINKTYGGTISDIQESVKNHIDKEIEQREREELRAKRDAVYNEEQGPVDLWGNKVPEDEIGNEGNELRHDKDSAEAKGQFVRMMMREIDPTEFTDTVMKQLFNEPFDEYQPHEDDPIYNWAVEKRVEFFGEDSKWNSMITIGDIVIALGTKADWDFGCGVSKWVGDWLEPHYEEFCGADGNLDMVMMADFVEDFSYDPGFIFLPIPEPVTRYFDEYQAWAILESQRMDEEQVENDILGGDDW